MTKQITNAVALTSSFKTAPKGTKTGKVHGNTLVSFALQLPSLKTDNEIAALINQVESGARGYLSNEELAAVFGARTSHLRKVSSLARSHKLTVLPRTASDKIFGIQRLRGTYSNVKKFLPGLELAHFVDENGVKFRGREGHVQLSAGNPAVGVFGLDTRDIAKPHHRFASESHATASAIPNGLTSRGIAQLQGFDVAAMDKVNDVVTGFVSLGGDNGTRLQADAATVAKKLGIAVCKVVGVSTDGTPIDGGADGYADGATVENALDLQAHALLNPNGYCVIFRADNSDDAFAGALEFAVAYEGVKTSDGRTLKLRAFTISWGMAESNFTAQSLQRWAKGAAAARLKGILVTAATGDNGSRDNSPKPIADAPSCVPGIVGAAGIGIRSTDGKTVSSRYVWGDTGGGISEIFAPTKEEAGLGLPVSADTGKPGHSASLIADVAAPECGPAVYYQGRSSKVGGTSHAAPIIGIKAAKMNKALEDGGTPVTDTISFVYANLGGHLLDQVTEAGTNGDYQAKPTDVINVPVGGGSLNYSKYLSAGKSSKSKAA